MYKIAFVVLATSALIIGTASAAPKAKSHAAVKAHRLDGARSAYASTTTPDSWESRSIFYQGPTYIGRY